MTSEKVKNKFFASRKKRLVSQKNFATQKKHIPRHPNANAKPAPARRRKSNPSHRVRARARALMKCCVVGNHLPPTSTARTTRRDLARRPTKFWISPFLSTLCHGNSHSLLWAAPLLAVPSQCRALTSVVSTASWAPRNRGNPSTASIGCDGCMEVQVTQQHVCAHTATRLLGSQQSLSGSASRGKMCESLWCLSTCAPASCCQPAPHPRSNFSTSFLVGLAPATTSRQDGGSNPTLTNP